MQRVHIHREAVADSFVGKLRGQAANDLLLTGGQIVNAEGYPRSTQEMDQRLRHCIYQPLHDNVFP